MQLHLNPNLRDRLADSERALAGGWVCSGSSVAAEIMAGSGLDLVVIDMEHSPNGLESTLKQLQAVAGYDVTAVVRVPSADPVLVKQVLDLGAQSIIVPMVSTVEQARAAVESAHYPPLGIRGVGAALARSARWNRVNDYLVDAESHIALFVQIETADGVENAAAIAATPGVSGVLVGPSDLAASLGLLGQQQHQRVLDAVTRTVAAVTAAGKTAGVNAFDLQAARDYRASGADFVLIGADVALLARASEALADSFIHGRDGGARSSY